jgi:LemA protein
MSGTVLVTVGVVVGVVLLGVVALAAIYNRLVTLRQRYLNAFSQIDVQLKRRHDLIPNLVEAAKGYMAHERQTLEAVTAARNTAAGAIATAANDPRDAAAVRSAAAAENQLLAAIGQFRAISEAYPQLKADQTIARLMEDLATTENRVAFARQNYNDNVMLYNTARLAFPAVLFAPMLGFGEAPLFEIQTASEREVVAVSLQ